ncbi:hypothetical protein C474_01712 [Halogeometricum pallidum JCM 14848]|uniref:Uncharacterized protein n=1 Tax=Halogeometricum pallidum JCM 14848 TaxID=1227487 RepID=M0DK24_HALPD|nr:DUF5827 family protein [Halogeometricum pallidum]ELZ35037.1 hypothetical protein C474_01712 [Halogeometricum pallidum JCM 14848]
MPKSKDEFDTLYPYQLYEPEEILEEDLMYTVPEMSRVLQGLDPETELDAETEDRIVVWTVPWLMAHADELVINDPEGDEPGYFGLKSQSRPADEIPEDADE